MLEEKPKIKVAIIGAGEPIFHTNPEQTGSGAVVLVHSPLAAEQTSIVQPYPPLPAEAYVINAHKDGKELRRERREKERKRKKNKK